MVARSNVNSMRFWRILLVLITVIITVLIYFGSLTTTMDRTEWLREAADRLEKQLEHYPPMVILNNSGEFSLEEDLFEAQQFFENIEGNKSIKLTISATFAPIKESKILLSSDSYLQDFWPPTLMQPQLEPQLPLEPFEGSIAKEIYEAGHLKDNINSESICALNGSQTTLLILVTSSLTHVDARLAIRQTWGYYGRRRDIGIAFVLGCTINDTINQALDRENYIYGDLIRGNNIDSYYNLTLKTMSLLEWVDNNCNHVKYLLKTDDDMFINVPKLLRFISQLELEKRERIMIGRLAKKWKPVRNRKSKYYVSKNQFPGEVYPAFLLGPAYLMTGDIVHELYEGSLKTVYLKLEDVFTTGFVAKRLGIPRVNNIAFHNPKMRLKPCIVRKFISLHMIKPTEQFDLWTHLLDQTIKC